MIHPDKIFGRLGNRMFQGAYLYAQMLDGKIPNIYLQDPKYFDHHRETIRKLFRPHKSKQEDYVAIHVRRGDYVNNPFYVDLMETDYYQKAMSLFPGETFVVLTDDRKWCMEQELFKDCEFGVWSDEITDLNRMVCAKGIIMANSSFSFWGAYLSDAEKIVAPSVKNWYSDGIERTKCLPEWTRI